MAAAAAPWLAIALLLAALAYGKYANTTDLQLMQGYYQTLMPQAASFEGLKGNIAIGRDASGAVLGYVGVSSCVGYGGPLLAGITVNPDGSLQAPVIFSHKETPAYLKNIAQEGFFKQYEGKKADAALTPGFDIDAVSGATLSSKAVAVAVNEAAHAIAEQAMGLTPQKAELPMQVGLHELAVAAMFALGLMASRIKKLAKFRLWLLILSVGVLGFWLNRSFSLAYVLSASLGFYPGLAQNLIWYIVIAGALLPALLLGKNIYCTFICPFCGLQEITHKISQVNLPAGPLMRITHSLRNVLLFCALVLGFLSLNPSFGSYEPFGVVFGMNGNSYSWYLLFVALVSSFFFHRFWCQVFCPAGAFLDFIAATRRALGKKLLRKNSAHSIAPMPPKTAAAPQKSPASRGEARPRKLLVGQVLFLLFYIMGIGCIVLSVWANTLPQ